MESLVSLQERLAIVPVKIVPCAVRDWLATLVKDEAVAGYEILATDRSNAQVHAAFKAEGYERAVETIRRHRIGNCSCP